MPYPLILSWPPSEFTAVALTMRHEQPVDFASVDSHATFIPQARAYPTNFSEYGRLLPGDAMRYGLEIVSDEFVSRGIQVFEVCSPREFRNIDDFVAGVTIREIADA